MGLYKAALMDSGIDCVNCSTGSSSIMWFILLVLTFSPMYFKDVLSTSLCVCVRASACTCLNVFSRTLSVAMPIYLYLPPQIRKPAHQIAMFYWGGISRRLPLPIFSIPWFFNLSLAILPYSPLRGTMYSLDTNIMSLPFISNAFLPLAMKPPQPQIPN